jgi:hypothetical protein
MNPGVVALHRLTNLGYQIRVEGQEIHLLYKGPGRPDPIEVESMFKAIQDHKGEVLRYLARDKTSFPERILSCTECPWHRKNLWTHHPELPAWCDWHFDHLMRDNPLCIGYRRGEVPDCREKR